MIRLETAKANRKCKECEETIPKGELCGVVQQESAFGTKKVSYCNSCTFTALEKRRDRIDEMMERLDEVNY